MTAMQDVRMARPEWDRIHTLETEIRRLRDALRSVNDAVHDGDYDIATRTIRNTLRGTP
jgi:hypothetical protein